MDNHKVTTPFPGYPNTTHIYDWEIEGDFEDVRTHIIFENALSPDRDSLQTHTSRSQAKAAMEQRLNGAGWSTMERYWRMRLP